MHPTHSSQNGHQRQASLPSAGATLLPHKATPRALPSSTAGVQPVSQSANQSANQSVSQSARRSDSQPTVIVQALPVSAVTLPVTPLSAAQSLPPVRPMASARAATPKSEVAPVQPSAAATGIRNSSLQQEMMTSVLPWMLAPMGAAAVLGYMTTDQQATQRNEQRLQDQVLAVSQASRDRLNDIQAIPNLVAPDPTVIEFSNHAVNPEASVNAPASTAANVPANANALKVAAAQAKATQTKLNGDLQRLAASASLSELVLADTQGKGLASNRSTMPNLPTDATWWQETQKNGKAIAPSFDAAGLVNGIDVAQAVVSPQSNQFLGVVKGHLPIDHFSPSLSYLAAAKLTGTQRIQILAAHGGDGNLQSVGTLSSTGFSTMADVGGGDRIAQIARHLVQATAATPDAGTNPAAASNAALPKITEVDYGNGTRSLLTHLDHSGRHYALATIPGSPWVAVASIDQKEIGVDQTWTLTFAGIILTISGISILAINRAARRLSRSLLELNQAFEQVSAGNLNAYVKPAGAGEVQELTQSFNQVTAQVKSLLHAKTKALRQSQFYADMAKAASRGDSQTVFELVVRLAKAKLSADRVVIYRFHENWSGSIVAEAVDPAWTRSLNEQISDPCMPRGVIELFRQGRMVTINDVAMATLVPEHQKLLERLQVKAYLIVPIVSSDRLLGLLIAHQCDSTRVWQPSAINILQELAAQTGLALTGVTLGAQKAADAERSRILQEVTQQVRHSLDTSEIVQQSVESVRTGMGCDRVVIYHFHAGWKSGEILAESVAAGWLSVVGETIHDPFSEGLIDRYTQGRIWTVDNIETENLTACHYEMLKKLQVKANIVAPIIVNGQLFGLICGHQCAMPRIWEAEDVTLFTQLANQIGFALDQAYLLQKQMRIAQRSQLLNDIVSKIRRSLTKTEIFNTVVTEVRQAFATDRVIVYNFHDDWNGTIIAESVDEKWRSILGETVNDPFREDLIEQYRNGRVRSMDDIYGEGLTPCHRDILEGFQIRSSITAPMLLHGQLIGLLCIHQCTGPRAWQPEDLELFAQLSTQLGFALEQADLYEQREQARLQAESMAQEQRQQTEALQQQLMTLLNEVEGAVGGDLTVRADVVAGEIGIVADFFNAIVESLSQIVTQVKHSTVHVNDSLTENVGAMEHLANSALKQAKDTTLILQSAEKMTQSVRAVANNACQAAEVARVASVTAATGGEAMDLTVQSILTLRGTIGETAKKVKRLGESSQQISRVVSLINQIAMQTNLLAVNAGIEASKAGEQGQGFAIVAEEVSELAARSATATQEIEQIVENIQRETSDVVKAMEQGTAQVVEGTQLVANAKQSLEQVLDVSRQIDYLVQSISDATVSQVETSHAISHLMRDAAQVAEQTSVSSRQVSDALRQTVAIAQDLQESVGMFQVA